VTTLLLPTDVTRDEEALITAAAAGELRLVRQPDGADAEIAVTGAYEEPFADVIAGMPKLRWVHSMSAGVDGILSPELLRRELWLTSSAGAYAPGMSDYVVAAMVFLARGWADWLEAQRERRWLDRVPLGTGLRGSTLGIVGYGSVGRHLALAAKALGMTVLATRRTPMVVTAEPVDALLRPESLGQLLAESDFVVVSAALTSETRGLIGDSELRMMKRSAFLINVSRGPVVDQEALAAALDEGRIAGAVLDVVTPEPLPPTSPLWDAANLSITPHVSGDTTGGRRAAVDLLCDNLRLYLDGQPQRMANLVDIRAYS
jgi:phosphoglycerate dehydrogenase-like enzyme